MKRALQNGCRRIKTLNRCFFIYIKIKMRKEDFNVLEQKVKWRIWTHKPQKLLGICYENWVSFYDHESWDLEHISIVTFFLSEGSITFLSTCRTQIIRFISNLWCKKKGPQNKKISKETRWSFFSPLFIWFFFSKADEDMKLWYWRFIGNLQLWQQRGRF